MIFEVTYKGDVRNDKDARAFFAKHQRIQRKIEKHFLPKIITALQNQYKAFLDAVRLLGYEHARNNIRSLIPVSEITNVLKEIYLKSGFIESNFVINYLKSNLKPKKSLQVKKYGQSVGVSLDGLAPIIDQYFDIYLLNRSALSITDTTRKYIIRHLVDEVDGGKDLDQAIEDFNELAIDQAPRRESKSLRRATGIAVTESTRALSFGGLIGAYMSNIDVDKVWVTCNDERVRGLPNYQAPYPHVDLDLNVANLFDAFYNGEMIRFPGDPEASLPNIARCRCAMYFREKYHPIEALDRTLGSFLNDFFLTRNG